MLLLRRSLKVASPINAGKFTNVKSFLLEYNKCVNYFIARLWSERKFNGKFLDKKHTTDAGERFRLTARLVQCAGKQAFEVVKSQRRKPNSRRTMPRQKTFVANLDNRFWRIAEEKNSFEWLRIKSGEHDYSIPFKRTVVWRKWESRGFKLANTVRISIECNAMLVIHFIFEKPPPPLRGEGAVEGVDLGYVDLLTCSDSQVIGAKMNEFIRRFQRREKNTYIQARQKAFQELKKFNLSGLKELVVEDLRSLRNGTRGMFSRNHNRRMSHWLYAKAADWLRQRCGELGVRFTRVSPWKTS